MEDEQDEALFAQLEDPATSLEELRAIHEEHTLEDAVSSALAKHPNADEALLEELALYPDEWVQRAVQEHPNATAAVARRVLETADEEEVIAAAKALKQRLTPSS